MSRTNRSDSKDGTYERMLKSNPEALRKYERLSEVQKITVAELKRIRGIVNPGTRTFNGRRKEK